ncbi:hypothetical protein [Peribacillus huizhouensis]|uniref:Uncharacterized protein n=1 Tax=Peribacillus huizhouensis TaxID=1501239 RepID=A0ABR6CVH0_9BACI|nr:hypothetical protein [Peribacillus huizhouensis]MBA9028317.1 hypothetical protein [Peribacillus huizhouensis]
MNESEGWKSHQNRRQMDGPNFISIIARQIKKRMRKATIENSAQ